MSFSRSAAWFASAWRRSFVAPPRWVSHVGRSMAPALCDGDRLRVEAFGDRPAEPGEIVLALRGEVLVAHRFVRWDGPMGVTRGDAVPFDDPPLLADGFLGRVVEIERDGRRLRPPSHPLQLHVRHWLRDLYLQVRNRRGIDGGGSAGTTGAGGEVRRR